MDDKLAIYINNQVHFRFDNYIFPELSGIILHHLLNHPELMDKYFKDFITPDLIIKYMVKDDEFLNGPLKENDILDKVMRIVEKGEFK